MHRLLDDLVEQMVARGVHFDDAQREFEKRFIAQTLAKCSGNLTRAADMLGVHRNTLTRRMKDLKVKARPSAA